MKNYLTIFFLLLVGFAFGQVPGNINITDSKPDKGTGVLYFNNIADMSGFTPDTYDSEIAKTNFDQQYWNWNYQTGMWESLVSVTADVKTSDFYIKAGVTDSLCVQLSTGVDYCQSSQEIANMLEDSNHMNTSQTKMGTGNITHTIQNGKHIYNLNDPQDAFEIHLQGNMLFSVGGN